MKYLINAAISLVIASSVMLFALNAPANWFHIGQMRQLFGSSFTTLVGTNQLSAFPTTYNANLGITANTSASNSFTGLQTFSNGIAITGASTFSGGLAGDALTLTTPLAVSSGGTSSTTLSQYAILLGNATGGLLVPSNGLGSNGQFLTSSGPGATPTWTTSSLNQASNYIWTGFHSFEDGFRSDADTTIAASSTSGNYLKLDNIAYAFPSSQGTANTSLVDNGSGGLTWTLPYNNQYGIASSTLLAVGNNTNSNTAAVTFPSGTLSASTTIQFSGDAQCIGGSAGTNKCTFSVKDNSGDTLATLTFGNTNTTCNLPFTGSIVATGGSAVSYTIQGMSNCGNTVGTVPLDYNSAGSESANLLTITSILGNYGTANGSGNSGTLIEFSIIILP